MHAAPSYYSRVAYPRVFCVLPFVDVWHCREARHTSGRASGFVFHGELGVPGSTCEIGNSAFSLGSSLRWASGVCSCASACSSCNVCGRVLTAFSVPCPLDYAPVCCCRLSRSMGLLEDGTLSQSCRRALASPRLQLMRLTAVQSFKS